MANSLIFSLPRRMPPACLILETTVASAVGTKSWYTLDPLVVKMPAVWYG